MTEITLTLTTTHRTADCDAAMRSDRTDTRKRSHQSVPEIARYTAKRYDKDGSVVLRYRENIIEDDAANVPVQTTLFVARDEVRLHRKGEVGGDMVFRDDTRCEFFYRTPFGKLAMALHTISLDIRWDDDEIRVRLRYLLYADGHPTDEICMDIYGVK